MTEIEKLILEVESRGLAGVNRELGTLNSKTKTATSSFTSLRSGIAAVRVAALAAAAAVGAIGYKLVQATKTYQDFSAQLKTTTGTAERAAIAYQALEDFAIRTPYSVSQAIESYIQLVNRGLKPSTAALTSFGNTASAMGYELKDMAYAVAAAIAGEYEPLRKFGIQAERNLDKVTFAFRGVKTTVDNTLEGVQGFFTKIGDTHFAGAMDERMKGLSGTISNLGDEWDRFWINISKQGPDSALGNIFRTATEALVEFNAMLASGEVKQKIKAYGYLWQGVADNIIDGFSTITGFIKDATGLWGMYGRGAENDFIEFFRYFPISAKAACEMVINYFINLYDRMSAGLKQWIDDVYIYFAQLVDYADAAGQAIYDFLFGDGNYDFSARIQRIDAQVDAALAAAQKVRDAEVARTNEVYELTLQGIVREHDERVAKYEEYLAEAERLRVEYDARNKTRQMQNRDALENLIPSQYSSASDGKKASKGLESQLAFLEEGIAAENRVLEASYEARKLRVLESTATTEAEKKDLVLRLMFDSLMTEEQAIRESYQTREDIILSSTETTEAIKTELMTRLAAEREAAISKLEQNNMDKRLSAASTFFGNLASVGSTFGKKGFKIAQGAAIAEATINTYKAATGAYASLSAIPYIGPALGIAAAAAAVVAGAANIAKIKSQTYAGAYEHGGMIPGGKYGLVGEAGPEIVRGPAIVTSAATTAASRASSSGVRTVTVHNNGQPVSATSQMNGDELIIMLQPLLVENKKQVKKELAGEIGKGGGDFSKKLEQTYGLRR